MSRDDEHRVRWGLTLPFAGVPLAAHEPLVQRAEAAGYDDLWTGETNGPDGFTPLALAAVWTARMRLGTGVVNPFTRGPAVLAQHAAALADASGGRFVLGLGSSSNVIVEQWNERPFEKPLSRMREVVPVLREVLGGGRGPGGFRLETPPAHPVPIAVAALRDRMLRLGGELGDGTFVNFLPLPAVEHVVARFMFAAYATVPVYEAFFRALGYGEAIDPMVAAWRDGDRRLAVAEFPVEIVREIFVFGDPGELMERLGEFVARGITTPVLTPIAPPERLAGLIDALAP